MKQEDEGRRAILKPIPAKRPDAVTTVVEQYLRNKLPDLAPKSRIVYETGIRYFLGFLNDVGVMRMSQIRPEHVLAFQHGLAAGHGLTAASTRVYIKVAMYVCRFAVETGRMAENPFANYPKSLMGYRRPTITSEMAQKMIEAGDRESKIERRDTAIIGLFYSAALPVSALLRLDVCGKQPPLNGIFPDGRVIYQAGSGRVVKIGIDQRTIALVDDWLAVRHAFARRSSEPAIFLSRRGRRMTFSSIDALVKRRARVVGLTGVSASQLRRRRGIEIISRTGIEAASFQLGHATTKNTRDILGEEIEALGLQGA